MPTATIKRVPGAIQPYPRSGNFTTQRVAYVWQLKIDGTIVNTFPSLKKAREAELDYTSEVPTVIRN